MANINEKIAPTTPSATEAALERCSDMILQNEEVQEEEEETDMLHHPGRILLDRVPPAADGMVMI
jgi:hypothetical protein